MTKAWQDYTLLFFQRKTTLSEIRTHDTLHCRHVHDMCKSKQSSIRYAACPLLFTFKLYIDISIHAGTTRWHTFGGSGGNAVSFRLSRYAISTELEENGACINFLPSLFRALPHSSHPLLFPSQRRCGQ